MKKFVNKKLSSSSKNWIKRSKDNVYTFKAQMENLPSRSYFKLAEINEKYGIFKKDQIALDLGCCPGGWSQYLKQQGVEVHGCDLLDRMKVEISNFILGDFTDEALWVNFSTYDHIVCDIGVNSTGNRWLDNYKNYMVNESVWSFGKNHLHLKGSFIIKLFESEYTKDYILQLKPFFGKIIKYKPKSSHSDSSEVYLVCLKYRLEKK